jgi:polysaccharide deacetylase family protein (PEP-CTERM system associated)
LEIKNNASYSAFSVDVEDGINILMHDMFNIEMPPSNRIVENIKVLLELFNIKGIRATFFILGEIASTYPTLIRTIASYNHEVGIHGYKHDQLFRLTPKKLRQDLIRSKSLVEEITGNKVFGFRAPAFSVLNSTKWSLEIISDLGFKYDSSIIPIRGKRYGWRNIRKDIHNLMLSEGKTLVEVPLSVTNIFGWTIPACGGGYLRYFPYSFTRKAFIEIQKSRPVIVYIHPYELDTEKYPDYFYNEIAKVNFKKRLLLSLYRLNKNTVKDKLEYLLDEFSFKPIIEIVNDLEDKSCLPILKLH